MSLTHLPNELLSEISKYLRFRDLNAFMRTSKDFSEIIRNILIEKIGDIKWYCVVYQSKNYSEISEGVLSLDFKPDKKHLIPDIKCNVKYFYSGVGLPREVIEDYPTTHMLMSCNNFHKEDDKYEWIRPDPKVKYNRDLVVIDMQW